MKISIFTTITNPWKYQYAWQEAMDNYCQFADEVIVVNGGEPLPQGQITAAGGKIKEIMLPWPEQWHWRELPLHLNAGLNMCEGDWAIKMDIDYFIHDKDFEQIYKKLREYQVFAAASFVKFNILNREKGYDKAVAPLAINRNKADEMNIQYGRCVLSATDWCYPIVVQGKDEFGMPYGIKLFEAQSPALGVGIYNYDYFFRTRDVAGSEFWRFAQAYATAFDQSWGKTEDEAWQIFINQMKGRVNSHILKSVDHPMAIKSRVEAMTPDEFGFNNWENFKNL